MKNYNAIVKKRDGTGAKYRKIPENRIKKFIEFVELEFEFDVIFFYEKSKTINQYAGYYSKSKGLIIN